ncbi:asparaginase [Metabacillus arenae]|uniref:asparaginase n=1 Tax=Metabacillus arenae TaxID=2771434 RepID=A0A926N7C3_9BACI|nr:asparaginase [Metabacillus arenae]MBD1378637.1 asparaginase [Metabacillus arenae]
MKKILIIHTGGTISMQEDAATGEVKQGKMNPLLTSIYDVQAANINTIELFFLPSPHITPNHMLHLKETIIEQFEKEGLDGIVVTHGTDTLEETAFFLDITTKLPVPIVMTGAMRSSNELGSDGLYNLLSAIKVASSEQAKELGVLVVMNDEIHAAANVTKTHTSNIATFRSPQYGPIGVVNKSGVFFHNRPIQQRQFQIKNLTKNVLLLKAYAGMDHSILEALEPLQMDGLVIEALGQGNLPPMMLPGIKSLLNKHIPIIIVSRCFNGIVQDVYSYEGGGKHLKQLGAIFSNGLNGPKARIKLMIALESTSSQKEIEEIFTF